MRNEMKNILILIGSPRKNGNTSTLANILIKNLDTKKVNTEICHLYNYEINPCIDCRACKKGDMKCSINDGMNELYSKIEKSEIIIIGSPIYWLGPTAKTKLLLDRFRPYYGNKKLSGKKGALLLPAGSGEIDCDLTTEMFRRSFELLGVEFLGAVTAKAYDIGDIEKDSKALEAIKKFGRII